MNHFWERLIVIQARCSNLWRLKVSEFSGTGGPVFGGHAVIWSMVEM